MARLLNADYIGTAELGKGNTPLLGGAFEERQRNAQMVSGGFAILWVFCKRNSPS